MTVRSVTWSGAVHYTSSRWRQQKGRKSHPQDLNETEEEAVANILFAVFVLIQLFICLNGTSPLD